MEALTSAQKAAIIISSIGTENALSLIHIFLAAGLAIPAICVAVWLAFTFLLFFICETRSRRIKRCTYFEIQKSAAILSRYGGKISADTGGIQRRLYIIPYDEMKLSVKKGRLVFTGKIRCYEGDSDPVSYTHRSHSFCCGFHIVAKLKHRNGEMRAAVILKRTNRNF